MADLDCQFFFNFLFEEHTGSLRLNAFAGVSEEEARKFEQLDLRDGPARVRSPRLRVCQRLHRARPARRSCVNPMASPLIVVIR